jgi:hypothetical protein
MSISGRIKKELDDLKKDKQSGVVVEQDPTNATHLIGV